MQLGLSDFGAGGSSMSSLHGFALEQQGVSADAVAASRKRPTPTAEDRIHSHTHRGKYKLSGT